MKESDAASLLIFPEGTRTEKGEYLNEFQRGAANIAIRANVPVRPVLITCTPSTLTKNEKWYHVPAQPFHIEIKVLDGIDVQDVLGNSEISPKHVRQLNQSFYIARHCFSEIDMNIINLQSYEKINQIITNYLHKEIMYM